MSLHAHVYMSVYTCSIPIYVNMLSFSHPSSVSILLEALETLIAETIVSSLLAFGFSLSKLSEKRGGV